ncbi:MAG TPA: response regulator [Terriglobia bacterium]|nr:response regulator [Terriglobia bacterium]
MRRKILIIDDEDSIREVVKVTLEVLSGWIAVTASSAKQGIMVAADEKPDAILLDVMMPDMDGFQTLHALQANPATRSIPVVMLTAKVKTGDATTACPDGVKGVILKPFNPLRLAGQISQALGW